MGRGRNQYRARPAPAASDIRTDIRKLTGDRTMKLKPWRPLAVLAVMTALAFATVAQAHDDHADSLDRAAVERIVHEYMQENPDIFVNYLLENPEIVEAALRSLQAKREAEERVRVQAAIRDNGEALRAHPMSPVSGNPDGDITVVEFFDYQCGYCKRALPTMEDLLEADPNVRVVWKEFPILGEVSRAAARAAMAADRQGLYLPFHLELMREPELTMDRIFEIARGVGLDMDRLLREMADPEIEGYIDETRALAQELGINGTPAFVIGGRLVPGVVNSARMKEIVAEVRSAERKG